MKMSSCPGIQMTHSYSDRKEEKQTLPSTIIENKFVRKPKHPNLSEPPYNFR